MRPITCPQERFDSKWSEVSSGCWEWSSCLTNCGYGLFRLGPKEKQVTAHRASWILHRGEIPEGRWVLHHCDNKKCVNPDHIYLGDRKQNTKDAVDRGRYFSGAEWKSRHGHINHKGINHPSVKLTEDDVRFIRDSDKTGVELAAELFVTPTTIGRIRRHESWSHIS